MVQAPNFGIGDDQVKVKEVLVGVWARVEGLASALGCRWGMAGEEGCRRERGGCRGESTSMAKISAW